MEMEAQSPSEVTVPEGLNPRSLLPTEVWASIIEYLTVPRDWLNFFYSSNVFRNESWLGWETDKNIRLFPEVLKVYWEKYERFQNDDSDSSDSEDESERENNRMASASKSIQMTRHDFFKKCRLVCKDWRNAIDNCFSQGPTAIHTKITVNQREYQRFNNFLQHCLKDEISRSWNPFPNKELTIFDIPPPTPYISIFHKNIERFLAKFGHHLKIFSHAGKNQDNFLSNNFQLHNCVHWYNIIKSWIEHMPNLEIMSLVYVVNDRSISALEHEVQLNPFPKLEKLKILHLEDTFLPVMHSAVETNNHLEKILLNRHSCKLPWLTMGNIRLNNLTTFYARLVSMEELNQLQHLNSPLKMVKVQIMPSFSEKVDILKCLKVLERFGETLTFLDLTVPSTALYNSMGPEKENWYDNSRRATLFTILSPFTSLEHVAISPIDMGIFYRRFRDRRFVEQFKVRNMQEYLDDWLVSPLWSQLPRLKQVVLKDVEPLTTSHTIGEIFTYRRPD